MANAAQNDIPLFFEVDISKIRVEPPQEGKTGNKQSLVKSDQFYKANGRIVCRIPEGTTAFALAEFKDKKTGVIKNPGKFNIQLKLEGSENGEDGMTHQAKMLYKFFTALEAHLKAKIGENDIKWGLKKNIHNSYISALKQSYSSTGEPYPMTLSVRVKFNPNDKSFITKFYDGKNKNAQIPVAYENSAQMVPRGTTGIWDISFNRIWYGPMGCGLTIDVERASVKIPDDVGGLPPMPVYEGGNEEENEKTLTTDDTEQIQQKLASMAKPSMEMEEHEVEGEDDPLTSDPLTGNFDQLSKTSTSKKTTTKKTTATKTTK